MKLSADKSSPNYHDVVHFIDQLTLDGTVLNHCVSIDTEEGSALVVSQPPRDDGRGNVVCHVVKGKVDIVWRSMQASPNGLVNPNRLFLHLKADWEERERVRKTRWIRGVPGFEDVLLHKGEQ